MFNGVLFDKAAGKQSLQSLQHTFEEIFLMIGEINRFQRFTVLS